MQAKNLVIFFLTILMNIYSYGAFGGEVKELTLKTNQKSSFNVTLFKAKSGKTRSAVVILGGARGYQSKAYEVLAHDLNEVGISVYLVHYLSLNDIKWIREAPSAHVRKQLYKKRLQDWIQVIDATVKTINQHKAGRYRIGVLGISLGAMPILGYSANNQTLQAVVAVDGNFLQGSKPKLKSMPPLLLIWGQKDQVFSVKSASNLCTQVLSLGGEASLQSYSAEGHAFFLKVGSNKSALARQDVVTFFRRKLLN